MFAGGTSWIMFTENATLLNYIDTTHKTVELSDSNNKPINSLWIALYVGGGRKDKINKIDIIGFFVQQWKIIEVHETTPLSQYPVSVPTCLFTRYKTKITICKNRHFVVI